jgi:Arabinose efflux permease
LFRSEATYSGCVVIEKTSISQFGEVRRGYKVMLAGALLIALAMPTISIYALPYFMAALNAEFGWERQEMGVAVSFLALTMFIGGPWVGRLVDRFGARRIAMVSIASYALGLAALSQLTSSIWTLYAGYVALALLGLGASHICYLRAVASWFDQARGIALGVAGSGAGLMAALAPQFLPQWIEAHGWRSAWLLLAALSLLAAPIMLMFVRERGDRAGEVVRANTVAGGMTVAEAKRSRAFWLMITGIFSLGVGLVGLTVQLVPLVVEVTGSRQAATLAGSLFGIGLMCGRLFTGFFLDRYSARVVSATMYSVPVVAMVIFASGNPIGPAVLGAGLGIAAGSENDILSYLVSRYFGLRSFSELFGWMFGTLSLGAAVGPLLINLLHTYGWDASSTLVVSGALCMVATVLYACLGPYPPLVISTGELRDSTGVKEAVV